VRSYRLAEDVGRRPPQLFFDQQAGQLDGPHLPFRAVPGGLCHKGAPSPPHAAGTPAGRQAQTAPSALAGCSNAEAKGSANHRTPAANAGATGAFAVGAHAALRFAGSTYRNWCTWTIVVLGKLFMTYLACMRASRAGQAQTGPFAPARGAAGRHPSPSMQRAATAQPHALLDSHGKRRSFAAAAPPP